MNILIMKPDSLENLMSVLKKSKRSIVTVIDVESNHISRSFINRLAEALFFHSADFDYHDSVMEESDEVDD